MNRRLLCFGFGYSAQALARALGSGWSITGTGRGGESSTASVGANVRRLRFDRDHPLEPPAFAGVTHILLSVPPNEAGDPVFDRHRDDIAAISGLAWLGYLSTTGVYGDRDGGWVDESRNAAGRGRRRAAPRRRLADLWRTRMSRCTCSASPGFTVGRSPFDALRQARQAHRQAGPRVLAHPCR